MKRSILSVTTAVVVSCATCSYALASGFPRCILPNSLVAMPEDVDPSYVEACIEKRFGEAVGATPIFVQTEFTTAKQLVESGALNAAVISLDRENQNGANILAVVTAVGVADPAEEMSLSSINGMREISTTAGQLQADGRVEHASMGSAEALQPLESWQFSALSDRKIGVGQHFHLVEIDCES